MHTAEYKRCLYEPKVWLPAGDRRFVASTTDGASRLKLTRSHFYELRRVAPAIRGNERRLAARERKETP